MALELPNGYILAEHHEWSKRAEPTTPLLLPNREFVFIHHSVTPATSDPCKDFQVVERVLADRGLLPGYSYLAHPSGVIGELAGDHRGAHTANRNSQGYGMCLVGNYDQMQPTLIQLINIARTINLKKMAGQIKADMPAHHIIGHNETYATACPGVNVRGKNLDWLRWFYATGV